MTFNCTIFRFALLITITHVACTGSTAQGESGEEVTKEQGAVIGMPSIPSGRDSVEEGEADELYDEAVEFVTQSRRASISAVQRRLRVGYNRAARLIETMEAVGVVSPMAANGNREVLVAPPPED